jgi:hypothetical protein
MITILFLCLVSHSYGSSCSKYTKVEQIENQYVNFILDLEVETPKDYTIPRDLITKKDILEETPATEITDFTKETISKKSKEIKEFLKKYGLTNKGYSNPKMFSFATTDYSTYIAGNYYKILIEDLFNENKDKDLFIEEKILNEHEKEMLFSDANDNDDSNFNLFLASFGYWAKSHGMNLCPQSCPNLRNILEQKWLDVDNYKQFLATSGYSHLVDFLSELLKKISFLGDPAFKGQTWKFDGSKRPLKTSPRHLYLFLETFYYNYENLGKVKFIPKTLYPQILSLRSKFLNYYLEDLKTVIGSKFTSFIEKMLFNLDFLNNNFLSSAYKKGAGKKWLTLGANDVSINLFSLYLKDKLKIDLGQARFGDSFYFVFTGKFESEVDYVFLFNSKGLQAEIDLKDLLSFTGHSNQDDLIFSQTCFGKPEY